MLVPVPNAFTVNSVGLEQLPFPFSVSKRETDWGATVSLTALRLADVADLLASVLRPHVLVCHAGHYEFETPDSNVIVSLSEVARRSNIDRAEFDVGWTMSQRLDSAIEAIAIAPSSLGALAETYFYNLELVDSDDPWNQDRVDKAVLSLSTSGADSVLVDLTRSTTRFSGHDDCYVWVETRSPEVAAAIIGRTIAMFAGTLLAATGAEPDVREPEAALLDQLFAKSSDWTAHPSDTAVTRESVDLSLAAVPWRLGEYPTGQVDGVLSYRLESAQWYVSL